MAIATYADLKAAVARWMNRTDLDLQIPDFITIAESRIALRLRAWPMVKSVALVQAAGTDSIALPTDWLEWDRLFLAGDDDALEYTDFRTFADLRDDGDIAHCGKYTMQAGKLYVSGALAATDPPVNVSATYYARIRALDDTNNVNWLLSAHPEVYLYGAAVSGWQYVLDETRAATNAQLFDNTVQLVNDSRLKAAVSGSQWRQRSR